jgi:hypothetical protein
MANFTPGVTTKDEIVAALGTPDTSSVESDGTTDLVYFRSYSKSAAEFIPVFGGFVPMHAPSSFLTIRVGTDGKMVEDDLNGRVISGDPTKAAKHNALTP